MASIIQETQPSISKKLIPPNAVVIEIKDDSEQQEIMDNQYYEWLEKEYIQSAFLTKNLEDVKKAIFTVLSRTKLKTDKDQADKTIRANYIEYFKIKMNIDISRAFYKAPIDAQDPNSQPEKDRIIVHGVDFLSHTQIENKFKGIYPVQIQRINESNAAIKFHENENVQNVLTFLKDNRKDPDLCEIQQQEWNKWKQLKKYEVLGFERSLKYRFAGRNERFLEKNNYDTKNFQIHKSKIQESDLFITGRQDKDYYELKIKEFEETLNIRRSRYSRNGRSQNGQSERSRTRDRNYGRRNDNDFKIDDFDRRLDRNDRGGQGNFTERGNFNDRNRGYQTERGNFDRRNDWQRNNFDGRENENRSNFRRSNDQDFGRDNRFFKKQDRKNVSRIEQEKDISYDIVNKSVSKSKSRSNSSRSYRLNESIQAPFNPANISMSFQLPQKTEAVINQDVSQSFIYPGNKSVVNPIQDATLSFILAPQQSNKQEDDDNKSQDDLQNILKKIDENEKIQKAEKKSRSNSSVASRRMSRKNSSGHKKNQGSVRGSNKGSQRQFDNRNNQRNERGNNQYGGRGNSFRQFGDNNRNQNENRNYGDNRDFNYRSNYNGENRFNNNRYSREGQQREGENRNSRHNNRFDQSNNNNYNNNEPRKNFEQWDKKQKPKPTKNPMDEDQIDY